MAVVLMSNDSRSNIGWAVFVKRAAGWRLAFRRLGAARLALRRAGNDLVVTTPARRAARRKCCSAGRSLHRRFRWNGGRFVIVRAWRTPR